jgi:ubiquinone/menaquinone biosynthesis C-methylase UbiE
VRWKDAKDWEDGITSVLFVMMCTGDTERQAILRDEAMKKSKKARKNRYISSIKTLFKSGMTLLDIGCGTAHIIQELAKRKNSELIGLDLSPAMLKIAKSNTRLLQNISFIRADGYRLPFRDCIIDIVINRLAEHSTQEAYRILKTNGFFLEYGLGPRASEEIAEFFQERIERSSFFFPRNPKTWKEEVSQHIIEVGFTILSMKDYMEDRYYEDENDLMNLIEMVPLVKDFDRVRDRKIVQELAKKYKKHEGIRIAWHYYVIVATKNG